METPWLLGLEEQISRDAETPALEFGVEPQQIPEKKKILESVFLGVKPQLAVKEDGQSLTQRLSHSPSLTETQCPPRHSEWGSGWLTSQFLAWWLRTGS